jgi:hypothetical protein
MGPDRVTRFEPWPREADAGDVHCDHAGTHSGQARYVRELGELRLLLVCDGCGAERSEVGRVSYRPNAHRVDGHLAELTARELGLSEARSAKVRHAALLSGIGRDQIPDQILNKREPLEEAEWAEIRRQPEIGAALVSDDEVREWILSQHERPDGLGYPRGLGGDQIPIEARIIAVVDAYAAMTSERPYRPARSHHEACAELWRRTGTQFDAGVVQAFLIASARRDQRSAQAAATSGFAMRPAGGSLGSFDAGEKGRGVPSPPRGRAVRHSKPVGCRLGEGDGIDRIQGAGDNQRRYGFHPRQARRGRDS